jgi:hypothetical protein
VLSRTLQAQPVGSRVPSSTGLAQLCASTPLIKMGMGMTPRAYDGNKVINVPELSNHVLVIQ